jgi:anaerobic magnesium-protoporphyrin IX monomethyl ester cyclase
MNIVLIYPPFAMPNRPHIALPCLAAYLKSRGVGVSAFDANIEFYHSLLEPESMSRSATFAGDRFRELEEKPALSLSQEIEYRRLSAIRQDAADTGDMTRALFGGGLLTNEERMRWFHRAVRLAAVPWFPEYLDFTESTNYIRYKSPFRKFSTGDILDSLKQPSLVSPFMEEKLMPLVREQNPDIVGISVAFPDQIIPAFFCAQLIRRHLPTVYITLGGSFISTHMRSVKEPRLFDFIDSLVLDNGEVPLERLAGALAGSGSAWQAIPGLVYYCRSRGKIVVNPPDPPLELATLPPPDYAIFPLDRYLANRESLVLLFQLSRGCYWGRCTFCNSLLPMIRCHDQPPAENLYQKLKRVIEQTGAGQIHFTDDAASPQVLEGLSRYIKRDKVKIGWGANVRFDKDLTLERLFLYREAGCCSLCLGLESYNNRVLRLMGKGITTALVDKILSNISWAGIESVVYMIVGFPGETEEEALFSFGKIKEFMDKGLISDCVYNIFEISPHSAISASPAAFGIEKISCDDDLDLVPPIVNFESAGMSRSTASRLCLSFIRELRLKGQAKKSRE